MRTTYKTGVTKKADQVSFHVAKCDDHVELPFPATNSFTTMLLSRPIAHQLGSVLKRQLGSVFTPYTRALQTSPIRTKVVTGAIMFTLGDLGSQTLVEGKDLQSLDVRRLATGAAFGGAFSGWLHFWWGWLELHAQRVVPTSVYSKWQNTAYKVLLDQGFSATLFNVWYVSSVSLLGGQSIVQCAERVKTQVPDQLMLHWQVWPAFYMFTFSYIPLDVSAPHSPHVSCTPQTAHTLARARRHHKSYRQTTRATDKCSESVELCRSAPESVDGVDGQTKSIVALPCSLRTFLSVVLCSCASLP